MADHDEDPRGLATGMHLSALALGLGSLLPWWGKRHASGLVRFHAEEALKLNLGFLALVITHVVLHGSILGVGKLQANFIAEGYPQPQWSMQMLVVLEYVNLVAGVVEALGVWGLALWGAYWASRGERRHYFFSKPKGESSS